MIYIILIIFGLLLLWAMVSQIVESVMNFIEDRAIRKSGLIEDLKSVSDYLNLQFDSQIGQAKKDIESFREDLYHQLPGLKDRVLRDRRRVDYIKNVLPKKTNFKHRKR